MTRVAAAIVAFALTGLASSACAGAYRIDLAPNPTLLRGHGGVEAVDDRTPTALVRIVTPGNDINDVGTLRVLVMNLGPKPFEVGPDEVSLSLADGTVLQPVPIAKFEKGREFVETETRHAESDNLRNRNDLPGLAEQANSGPMVQSPGAAPPESRGSSTQGHDRSADNSRLPGEQMLDSIYQLLIPLTVEQNKAWGGYYVFQLPKSVYSKRADQPLIITVRTGAEMHRFAATLKWK